ncbi:MAG: 2-oxoacid:acceptor oxidoreductase family protein [Fidelibacterota bacterium]|nr:MAG: 2-oxoacid:acceptor oxidoreductase family protein [Candidatus Neomarinimicrobiota bacterium]
MKEEVLIAGFGGQGVLTLGMVLAYAGMVEGKEVSWMPSYGPEMRGGTANCIAILSDEPISSPILTVFDTAMILNQPSMDKFESSVKPGGLLVYESNNILNPPSRKDITHQAIAAVEEASRLENSRVLNMIMLGAFLFHRPILGLDSIKKGLMQVLPERYHHLLPINEEAIQRGKELASNNQAVHPKATS